jgi:Ni2+-binding GTPase involved in maturation of urease and hydrogenase
LTEASITKRPVSERRIPVFVLTGFLGSGKTTLLSRLIRSPAMTGTLVVINEFGDLAPVCPDTVYSQRDA